MSEPQRLDLIAPTNDQTVRNNPRDPFLSRNKRWRETHVSLTMQLLPQRSDGPQYLSLSQLCLSVSLSLSLSLNSAKYRKKNSTHIPGALPFFPASPYYFLIFAILPLTFPPNPLHIPTPHTLISAKEKKNSHKLSKLCFFYISLYFYINLFVLFFGFKIVVLGLVVLGETSCIKNTDCSDNES